MTRIMQISDLHICPSDQPAYRQFDTIATQTCCVEPVNRFRNVTNPLVLLSPAEIGRHRRMDGAGAGFPRDRRRANAGGSLQFVLASTPCS